MVKLLEEKMKAVECLKCFTKGIISISAKTDYVKLCSMIIEREKLIQDIKIIDAEIQEYVKIHTDYKETSPVKNMKTSIRNSFKEIVNMDKEIRKIVNDELKVIKSNFNHPSTVSKSVNIKI